jgi:predicted RNase H-like nuclease (RuvC/YqgF family)
MSRIPRNTCPNIDRVIDFLKEVSENEDFERGARWMIDVMEELRGANSMLRGFAEDGIEAQERVEELESEVEELKSEVEDLKGEVSRLEKENEHLEEQLSSPGFMT